MFYFFQFLYNIIRLGLHIIVVRKKAVQQSTQYLIEIEKNLSGKFTEPTFKKIVKSYSVWLTTVANSFMQLHRRKANAIEQERNIHYFICSTLFDDFFDDKLLSVQQVEDITFNYQNYQPQSFDEKAFLNSHKFLLGSMQNPQEYLSVLRKEFDAQVASLNQFNKNISDNEIQHITFEKGGNAVLMCNYYTDVYSTDEEKKCWYVLGTLIQFSNDLFDIYKDLQDGIETFATRCTDAFEIEKLFLQQVNDLKKNIQTLPYKKSLKQYFSIAMAFVYVLGLIAIDNLKRLQKNNHHQLPYLKSLHRKELVIDMEKPKNIFKEIKLAYKYARI